MGLTYHRSYSQPLEEKYARVSERLSPRSQILEIGCHSGYFSHYLIQQNHQVIGIERNEEAAKVARAAGISVWVKDIESPEFISSISEKFDAILLMDVLEHLIDPEGTLNRLQSLLTEKGKILITAPNIAYWAVRKNLLLGRWDYTDGGILDNTHLHFYTARTWKELVEKAGYEIQDLKPADGMIPLEQVLRKIPLANRYVQRLRHKGMQLFPELFTIDFLIEAVKKA